MSRGSRERRCLLKLVDLTQPWGDRMPTWPQFASIEVTDITTHHRDGKSTVLVKTNMHTGTHIDAPIHYWPTGKHLGEIPIGDLYGTALAVDFVERLRDTRPFAGVAQLVEQLRADVKQARQLASPVN